MTINPAKQLRIDNRVGSLEVGKDADVVIWNHHPLSSYAIADRVYIDGQQYYDRLDDQKRLTELAQGEGDADERRARRTAEPRRRPSRDAADATGEQRTGRRQDRARTTTAIEMATPPDVSRSDHERRARRHGPGSKQRASSRSPTRGSCR